MPLRIATWVVAVPLVFSATANPQSNPHHPDALVARLSYQSTHGTDWREQQDSPRICFALYTSGHYRMMRLGENGMQTVQGNLSGDDFATLGTMLRDLPSDANRGGEIVRQGSESFRIEILRGGGSTEFEWINPDHEHPFPRPAMQVVRWLQQFRDPDAVTLTLRELSEQQICPAASTKPVEPVVASRATAHNKCE
jgi:hypothetical protein